jgi:hypothetical protein
VGRNALEGGFDSIVGGGFASGGALIVAGNVPLLGVRASSGALVVERHASDGTTAIATTRGAGDPIAIPVAGDGRIALILEVGERRLRDDPKAPVPMHGVIAIVDRAEDLDGLAVK